MIKIAILTFAFILFSACNLNISVNNQTPTASPPTNTSTPTAPSPSPAPSIEDQLTTFFSTKFSKPVEDVILTVSENTGTHAKGGIKFTGEISGAMWLAHQDSDIWYVDYDGHGVIPCASVEPFSYPTSMVSECWDETTGSLRHL